MCYICINSDFCIKPVTNPTDINRNKTFPHWVATTSGYPQFRSSWNKLCTFTHLAPCFIIIFIFSDFVAAFRVSRVGLSQLNSPLIPVRFWAGWVMVGNKFIWHINVNNWAARSRRLELSQRWGSGSGTETGFFRGGFKGGFKGASGLLSPWLMLAHSAAPHLKVLNGHSASRI